MARKSTFKLYTCRESFKAYDERHMNIEKNEMFLGFSEHAQGNGDEMWVFGCPDNLLSEFGFVPSQYLKLLRTITRDKHS